MSVCVDSADMIRPADVFPFRGLPGVAEDWGRTVEKRIKGLESAEVQGVQTVTNHQRAIAGAQEYAAQVAGNAREAKADAMEALQGVVGALEDIGDLDERLTGEIFTAQGVADSAAGEASEALGKANQNIQDIFTINSELSQTADEARDAWNMAVAAQGAAAGANLYPDGSFEGGGAAFSPSNNWEIIQTPLARAGDFVMRAIAASGTYAVVADRSPIDGESVVQGTMWVRRSSSAQIGEVGIRYQREASDGSLASGWVGSADLSSMPVDDWVRVDGKITLPPTTVAIRFYPFVAAGGAAAGIWVDSVRVVDVTAAEAAMNVALQAQQDAAQAESQATTALTAANGKNKIYRSTSAPSGSGTQTGDVWWRYSNSNFTGPVIGQWTWSAGGWQPSTIGSEIIEALTVDKLSVTGGAKIPTAVIDTLISDEAFLKSLYTNRVIVDAQDFAPGPAGYKDAYSYGSNTSYGTSTSDPGGYALIIDPDGGTVASRSVYGPYTRVQEGQTIAVNVRKTYSGAGDNARVNVRMFFYDKDRVELSQPIVWDYTGSTSSVSETVVVPADAVEARIRFYAYDTATNRKVYFNTFNVRPQVGAVLIEDGAVTAPKITASSELSAKVAEFIEVKASQLVADTAGFNYAFVDQLVGSDAYLNSVYTNRVIVDATDFAPGPGGFDSVYDFGSSAETYANSNDPSGRAIRIYPSGGSVAARSAYGPMVPVREGTKISFEAYAFSSGSPDANWSTFVYWYGKDGNAASTERTSITTEAASGGSSGWSRGVVTAPAGATHARVRFYSAQGSQGYRGFRNFNVRPQVGAVLIEDGAVTADKLTATAIDGMTITGATVRTAASGKRVVLDSVGLRTYNSSGVQTAILDADAEGMFIGQSSYGVFLGVESDFSILSAVRNHRLANQIASFNTSDTGRALPYAATVQQFNRDASAPQFTMAYFKDGSNYVGQLMTNNGPLYLLTDRSQDSIGIHAAGEAQLTSANSKPTHVVSRGGSTYISAYNAAATAVRGQITVGTTVQIGGTGNAFITSTSDSTGPRLHSIHVYERTYGGAANMYITNAGTFGRSTSTRKHKLDEQIIPRTLYEEALLSIPFKSWVGKQAVIEYNKLQKYKEDNPYAPTPPSFAEVEQDLTQRHIGAVSEDFIDVGLEEFVTFDSEGEPDGLQYDRIGVALIPIVADLKRQVEELKELV